MPKIGILGWIGIVLLIVGAATFIGARKDAEKLVQTTWETSGSEHVFEDEALAKGAGYESYSDYLAGQNRKSGLTFVGIGAFVFLFALGKNNGKKNSPPQKAL